MKTLCSMTSVANVRGVAAQWKLWLALIGLAFFVSCTRVPQQTEISGETMGTTYSVRFISGNPEHSAEKIQANIDGLLAQINAQMSTYDPDSELSRFNASRETTPHVVSRSLEQVVKRALEIAKETDGLLDVTIGPVVNLWGFGPEQKPEVVPTQAEIDAMLEEVGYQYLEVSNHQLTKSNPELYVDLSTIAKGYAVDRVATVLEQLEINNYMIEIGGEIRVKGSKPENKPWRIAIERPESLQRGVQRVVEPNDQAIATSGDYRNYYQEDGVRYSHLIDPRTGRPIQHHLVSATVLAPTCMDADAYATALIIMGPEEALAFAEEHDLAVLLVTREEDGFKEYTSTAFEPYLLELSN